MLLYATSNKVIKPGRFQMYVEQTTIDLDLQVFLYCKVNNCENNTYQIRAALNIFFTLCGCTIDCIVCFS